MSTITHRLETMQRNTEPSGSSEWGPLERFIAHCTCGWKTDECYPESVATGLLELHIDHEIPGIPKPPGSRKIKLSSAQVEWLTHIGPFPFTCNQNTIDWPEHTDAEVIAHIEKHGGSSVNRGLIVRKLMGEIQ